MKRRDKEISDVYAAEKSRGRKHRDQPETVAEKRLQREIVRMILNPGIDLRGYQAILREYGLQEGSPEFDRFVKIWMEYRG